MSLIHDALKKAQQKAHQKEGAPLGSGVTSMEQAVESSKRVIPKRTIVLAAVLVVALALFAYMRFKPKGETVQPLPAASVSQEKPGEKDVGMLKKRAINAYKSDDFNTAWSNLQTAASLDEKDPEIWNNLGVVAKKRGDVDKAREYYQKALVIKPDYPEALSNIAVIEMEGGNNTKAIENLDQALKLSPAYPEANFHLALIYDKKGDKEKAVQYYKRFLDVGGGFSSNVIDAVRDHLMEIEK